MAVTNIRNTWILTHFGKPEGQRQGASPIRESPISGISYNLSLKGDYQGFKEIQAIKIKLNEFIEMTRRSDYKKDFYEKVKEGLTGMTKFFPPYPPGSEERVRFLKGYVAFRMLIERLTIPPDTMNMTEDLASEKSGRIREAVAGQKENLSGNPEAIHYLLNEEREG